MNWLAWKMLTGDTAKYLLPDEGLVSFMEHCHQRIGEAYFRTPRTTIICAVGTRWLMLLISASLPMNAVIAAIIASPRKSCT